MGRQRAKVVGALDDATGQWWHDVHDQTIRREDVVALIDRVARRAGADALTLVVLDNASMHPAIDPQKREDGLVNHRLVLRHRPPYSPALNLSERVWKPANYHWRRFVTWAKEPVREEVVKLIQGFGSAYQISFA